MTRAASPSSDEFMKLVEVDGDGHWYGGNDWGYIYLNGRQEAARRVAWRATVGEIDSRARLHRTCDEPRCISPKHHRSKSAGHGAREPLRDAVESALGRSGMTLGDALGRAGLSRGAWEEWCSGASSPWYDSIKAFADVLGAPEIVQLIPARHRRIVMTCNRCDGTKTYLPSTLRKQVTRGLTEAEVSWEHGNGTYVCGSCTHRRTGDRLLALNVRRHRWLPRDQYLRESGARLASMHRDDDRRVYLEIAAAKNTGSKRSDEQRLRMSAAQIGARVDLTGRWFVCPFCGKSGYASRTEWDRRAGAWHGRCRRRWSASEGDLPMPIRAPSAAALMEGFLIATAYLLRGEPIGSGEHGTQRRDGNLPDRFSITPRTAWRRLEQFMALLPEPDDEVATMRVRKWSMALTAAWKARAGAK